MIRGRYGIGRIRMGCEPDDFFRILLEHRFCNIVIEPESGIRTPCILPFHFPEIVDHVAAAQDQIAIFPESSQLPAQIEYLRLGDVPFH